MVLSCWTFSTHFFFFYLCDSLLGHEPPVGQHCCGTFPNALISHHGPIQSRPVVPLEMSPDPSAAFIPEMWPHTGTCTPPKNQKTPKKTKQKKTADEATAEQQKSLQRHKQQITGRIRKSLKATCVTAGSRTRCLATSSVTATADKYSTPSGART